ncbi:hypothetical protein P154DRAFT_571157 [Amniculicola lignicola CBS 123094]|uniref:Uncharacterized protein n=1 Tax=Amniculicola lignicola CBS 123094 TaxID=1392246 RepID=A0A6A5WV21_9PLEO|nr:hypothetical protein P154DRAFT_571157 [Amniculicola lignicola CBS 123094]
MAVEPRATQSTSHVRPQTAPFLSVPTLVVRYPHYPGCNTLVKLPVLDDGDTVDYDVALPICGIRQQLGQGLVRSLAQPTAATCASEVHRWSLPMGTSSTLSAIAPVSHSHSQFAVAAGR